MMLLKPILCLQQQEVVESQQIEQTGEQLSIVIGDEWVLVELGGIMYIHTVPVYIYNFTCKFFYYKSVFSQIYVYKINLCMTCMY